MSEVKLERKNSGTDVYYEWVDSVGDRCAIKSMGAPDAPEVWIGMANEEGCAVLNREQVAALIPLLQAFVDTGELPK